MKMRKKVDKDVAAAITAALSMYLSTSEFRVVSIREERRPLSAWKLSAIRTYRRFWR